jgi:NAD(P)H-flavin reductase
MLNTYKTILSQRTQLTSDVYLYHFDLAEPKKILFTAGQYLMIKVPTDRGPLSRLYSIASSSEQKNDFDLIVQIFPGGLASTFLSNLSIQDQVVFQGPAGKFSLNENDRTKIFLATGTGIAPIKSILTANFSMNNFHLFWGLKTFRDVYLLDQLKKFNPKICLSREENLEIIPKDDKQYFNLGHVDLVMEKQGLNIAASEFYLCGGREVVESLRQGLLAKNILPENIYFEKF